MSPVRTGRTIYLHGVPGTPAELTLAGHAGWEPGPHLFAPDRNLLAAAGSDDLADAIARWAGGEPVRLVGFSLGAAAALRVAARLGGTIAKIDLIAPAAPLSLGDFLGLMAGGALFRLARDHPRGFAAVCSLQGALARIAPRLLARMTLAGCQGGDKPLAADPAFQKLLGQMLAGSLSKGATSYKSEIAAYVANWEDCLSSVTQSVEIWQGDLDNWVVPEMASALAGRLSGLRELHMLPGLSHYSALAWYLARFSSGGSPP